MIARVFMRRKKPLGSGNTSVRIISQKVEYLYYFAVAYSLWAGAIGIEVPLVAAGLTIALAGYCISNLGSHAREINRPIVFLIACIVTFIIIQTVIHGIPVTQYIIREFVVWVSGLVVVYSLCLRPSFMHRYMIVLFALGLIAVPYLTFSGGLHEVSRAYIGINVSGNLSHENGLGNWFGFCATYFAIFGLETKRNVTRAVTWSLATACLIIVGVTVSRGALLATALATSLGFRRILGRGFAPLILLLFLIALAAEAGLFTDIISRYEERGTEETGRLLVWPYVIERFFSSPLLGVGVLDIATFVPEMNRPINPHNTFLFFALSSGVVPLALYLAYWIQAGRRYFARAEPNEYAPYQIPFLLYVLVTFLVGDVNMASWVLLALTVGAGAGVFQPKRYSGTARTNERHLKTIPLTRNRTAAHLR
jgi:hypothetical protein